MYKYICPILQDCTVCTHALVLYFSIIDMNYGFVYATTESTLKQ